MTQTNRRLSALLAALLLILPLCACSSVPRITDEAAMPLQHVIDGVINGDLRTYLSAFPDDYVTAITEEYEAAYAPTLRRICRIFSPARSTSTATTLGTMLRCGSTSRARPN